MKAILTDVTKCVGCEKCVVACTEANKLPPKVPARWTLEDGLSAERFTAVERHAGSYVRKQCRHCVEPACASACPVGALHKTAEGPVVYDGDKCLGCRYCMMACPFGIPRYQWGSAVPYVRKCTMCYETRLKAGQQPACTEACPEKATIFGERGELISEAHRRLREHPGKYQNAVWGELDAGGTSVLYVAPVDLEFLNLGQSVGARALPRLTQTAMNAVPPVFVSVGIVLGGVHWIIGRRRKLAGGEGEGHGPHGGAPGSASKEDKS